MEYKDFATRHQAPDYGVEMASCVRVLVKLFHHSEAPNLHAYPCNTNVTQNSTITANGKLFVSKTYPSLDFDKQNENIERETVPNATFGKNIRQLNNTIVQPDVVLTAHIEQLFGVEMCVIITLSCCFL